VKQFAFGLSVALFAVSTVPNTGRAQDLDCEHFSSQQEAQGTMNALGHDRHNLDADDDGVACEHLPVEYEERTRYFLSREGRTILEPSNVTTITERKAKPVPNLSGIPKACDPTNINSC